MNSSEMSFHIPVLLKEVVEGLSIQKDAWYVDATAGGGGHTRGILDRNGKVLAVDQDVVAVERLKELFAKEIAEKRMVVAQANFRSIKNIVEEHAVTNICGFLFDLGMSTFHIKQSGRGFSFLRDEPLDMRMSETTELTAETIVNTYSEEKLYGLFAKYGEEFLAGRIAESLVWARSKSEITTTRQLALIVEDVYKVAHVGTGIHPATKVFQALRIAVNEELASLQEALPDAFEILSKRGRLAVISFHSLEDRIVKQFFLKKTQGKIGKEITKKPMTANYEETSKNSAARSAKLRIIEKI